MCEQDWLNYFESNAKEWISDAYVDGDYSYPVGYHRLRILKRILKDYKLKDKRVLDIGCGGGDISFYLASMGAIVDGVDMSSSMLEIINDRKDSLSIEEQDRLSFHQMEFHDIPNRLGNLQYDYVIAFGLIGYLESDSAFFETINSICHSGTVVIISCRNRLFNMTSITNNTIGEINSGCAIELIKEIDECYQNNIPAEKVNRFVSNLKEVAKCLNGKKGSNQNIQVMQDMSQLPGTGERQPRQSTPRSISKEAKQFGFVSKHFWGVHPHLLLPRLNKILPPTMFNVLSDALCAFEDEAISLIYSSVFIVKLIKV